MKEKHSRIFIYKIYKIICKLLKAEAICYGKLFAKDEHDVIYAIANGMKHPLRMHVLNNNHCDSCIALRKNAKKDDIQKAIVNRLLKVLETSDIWIDIDIMSGDPLTIKKNTCFEQLAIEMDLNS